MRNFNICRGCTLIVRSSAWRELGVFCYSQNLVYWVSFISLALGKTFKECSNGHARLIKLPVCDTASAFSTDGQIGVPLIKWFRAGGNSRHLVQVLPVPYPPRGASSKWCLRMYYMWAIKWKTEFSGEMVTLRDGGLQTPPEIVDSRGEGLVVECNTNLSWIDHTYLLVSVSFRCVRLTRINEV